MKRFVTILLVMTLCLSGCARRGETPTPSSASEVTPTPVATPVPTPSPTAEPSCDPMPSELPVEWPVYSDPITGFYDTLQYDESYECTPFGAFLAGEEARAWEREAQNVFSYLKENAHPDLKSFYPNLDLEQFEEDFFAHVDTQSYLDAYIGCTDLLGNEVGTWGDHINRGTAFSAYEMRARIERYRFFVTQWYDAVTFDTGKTDLDRYVFSPEEALACLMEGNDLKFEQGSYRLEKDEDTFWKEELLENPIDGWVAQWLYQDGTTVALISDAYREAEIWREELCHAYEVLEACANPVAELTGDIQAARESIQRVATVYGDVVALTFYSNAFSSADQEGELWSGNIVRSFRWNVCANYYRHETLRLWARLIDQLGKAQPTWVFDAEEQTIEREFQTAAGQDLHLWGDDFSSSQAFRENSGYLLLKELPQSVDSYSRSYGGDVCVEAFREWNGEDIVLLTDETALCQEFVLTSDRHMAGIGGVTVVDANFDGNDDLLLRIGGERGPQTFYAAFLWEKGMERYRYEPSFSDIPNATVDIEHSVVWGGNDFSFQYSYGADEFVDGEFVHTHGLVGEYLNLADWGEGAQCTEYARKGEEWVEVGKKEYPGMGLTGALEAYIAAGAVWEGWNWCDDIRAFEPKG